MFQGSIVALTTPFTDDLAVDTTALEESVDIHVKAGTSAVIPCGTTGESATLSPAEHDHVVETVCRAAEGRVPVIAGAGSNCTAEAVAQTRHAAACGASAALSVVPYYNRPSQEGLFRHFETIAREGGLPVVLYNVPSRTSCNLEADTVARLAEVPGIVAVKEASGNVAQIASILARTDLDVLSGDDPATLALMGMGAKGVVSVTANVHPEGVAAMVGAALAGNPDVARRLHERLLPLHAALFVEPNPAPAKAALALLGRGNGKVRLPLVAASKATYENLRKVMIEIEILQVG
jgi:4-hydroxy-tetrahydrodipicolinate synthase